MYTKEDFDIKLLGSFYFTDKTIFRVFSPKSEKTYLVINDHRYEMHRNGLCFEIGLGGDLEKVKYYYENELGERYKDPFAYYNDDNYSYVLNTDRFITERCVPSKLKDIVIYEANVRDFSCDDSYDGDCKRTFLALAQEGIKKNDYFVEGLDYLKNLGISHIQLMPVFDYDLDGTDYNWGYNPKAYNSIYNGYVYDKDNPYAYINELRKAVNILHKNNIRVTLDVVFNHVYRYENFDIATMIGKNCFRYKEDGTIASGTMCGNEINSEDPFIRAYIIEMVERYIKLFDIDGIRMDLMGILDYETVNMIDENAKAFKRDFIVYGEGWNMGDVLAEDRRACINNASKMPSVAMFNDYFRDNIINYVCGNNQIREDVKRCLSGDSTHMNYKQSINYVECHDNYTFFDRLMKYKAEDSLEINIRRAKLALGLVLTARGLPFIQMGQEFLRTKNLLNNSYNAGESINKIDWNRRVEYNDICDYLKGLIEIRRQYPVFVRENVEVSFEDYFECIIYRLDDIMIIINPSENEYNYESDKQYSVIFDLNGKCCYTFETLSIPAYSLLICKANI